MNTASFRERATIERTTSVAVANLDSDGLGDPESLERLRQSAFKFTLADDEKRSLDLRIGGG
jgi:hypothetical protein